jgi:hypothetical protein
MRFRIGRVVGPCEQVMNLRVPKKGGEFLDQLSDYYVHKKDSGSMGFVN